MNWLIFGLWSLLNCMLGVLQHTPTPLKELAMPVVPKLCTFAEKLLFHLLPFSSQQKHGPASCAALTHTHTLNSHIHTLPHTQFTLTLSHTDTHNSHTHSLTQCISDACQRSLGAEKPAGRMAAGLIQIRIRAAQRSPGRDEG